jgi:hypothetical protein
MLRRLRARRGEEGSFSLELAVAAVGLMAVVLLAVQAGLYYHATQSALAAANSGLDAAQAQGPGAATQAARSEAGSLGGVDDVGVQVSGTDLLSVRVSGTAPQLFPGFPVHISEQASGPRERFVGP